MAQEAAFDKLDELAVEPVDASALKFKGGCVRGPIESLEIALTAYQSSKSVRFAQAGTETYANSQVVCPQALPLSAKKRVFMKRVAFGELRRFSRAGDSLLST